MIVYGGEANAVPCEPGVTRKILAHDKELMMCEISFQKGARGNSHKHPHLQITYVAAGSFEFTLGEETKTVKKGDGILIPRDTMHGVLALEDGQLVDIFNPAREDFLRE